MNLSLWVTLAFKIKSQMPRGSISFISRLLDNANGCWYYTPDSWIHKNNSTSFLHADNKRDTKSQQQISNCNKNNVPFVGSFSYSTNRLTLWSFNQPSLVEEPRVLVEGRSETTSFEEKHRHSEPCPKQSEGVAKSLPSQWAYGLTSSGILHSLRSFRMTSCFPKF
jgi:hypothetical protein